MTMDTNITHPKVIYRACEKVKDLGFKSARVEAGMLYVSAEDGDDAADYYGEFHQGWPWINPKLECLAKSYRAYWDWVNPGQIVLSDI